MKLLSIAGILLFASMVVALVGCNSVPNRGPVFAAIERTLAQRGPVKDDLVARGLVTFPSIPGSVGSIKVGEIEKLVQKGVYAVDKNGYLVFGPNYTPPTPQVNSSNLTPSTASK